MSARAAPHRLLSGGCAPNRDDSGCRRLAPQVGGVGLVPLENLVGRVEVVLGSWDLGIVHDPIWTWPSVLRLGRFFCG